MEAGAERAHSGGTSVLCRSQAEGKAEAGDGLQQPTLAALPFGTQRTRAVDPQGPRQALRAGVRQGILWW